MYWFANSPTVDMLPANLHHRSWSLFPLRTWTHNAFVDRSKIHNEAFNVTLFWLHTQMYRTFCYISEYIRKKQPT